MGKTYNIANNLGNKTNIFIGIVGIIVSIFIGWWGNREKTISLNIETLNETLLTKPLNIDGLTTSYIFHDSIYVTYLWQSTFVIKNTGNSTIYGDGFQERNIRTNSIPFTISNNNKVLSVNINQSNNGAFLIGSNNICISQWRPGEYIEITLITEGEFSPALKISDREIKDSQITYSVYSIDNKEQKKTIIKYFPKIMSDIIKVIMLFFIAVISISLCYSAPQQFRDAHKYKILTILIYIFTLFMIMSPLLWMFEI